MARPNIYVWASAALALWAAGGSAQAGGWTKEPGDGLAVFTLSLHQLLPPDPLIGHHLVKNEASVYAEYGWSDRVTLVGRAAWQTMENLDTFSEVTTFAEEIERPPDPKRDDPDEDYDDDGVPNRLDAPPPLPPIYRQRSRTRYFTLPPQSGVGGLEAGVRYKLRHDGRWALAVQGLAGLQGTGENWNNDEFGDGAGSLDLRLQAGRSFGRSTFLSVSGGARVLQGDRPDEVRVDITAGTHVMRGVRVMAQTYSVWSIGTGRYQRHEYSGHRLQLSVLWPIDDVRRAQIAALTTFERDNMSRETAIMASLWRTF